MRSFHPRLDLFVGANKIQVLSRISVRPVGELDFVGYKCNEISTHPDAPMDWNAIFVGDKYLVFGVEMFKIFGQVLDFVTMFDVSDASKEIGLICLETKLLMNWKLLHVRRCELPCAVVTPFGAWLVTLGIERLVSPDGYLWSCNLCR
ncbi:hypothetical protein Tco_0614747 [Tanacetum coccineum]